MQKLFIAYDALAKSAGFTQFAILVTLERFPEATKIHTRIRVPVSHEAIRKINGKDVKKAVVSEFQDAVDITVDDWLSSSVDRFGSWLSGLKAAGESSTV